MLIIELNRADYEYDVNSLVRAFYPGERVTVLTPDSTQERKNQTAEAEKSCLNSGGEVLRMAVELCADGAKVSLCVGDEGSVQDAGSAGDESRARDGVLRFCWEYAAGNDAVKDDVVANDASVQELADEKNKKSLYKREFKRFLYRVLRDYTGKELPWGSLIGIRPTKIAYGMLDEGAADAEILEAFTEVYDVSDEKAKLGLAIAKREREILKDVHYEGGYSLYIGIPFCPTTCLYCSFTSYPIAGYRGLTDSYIDCLIREMEFTAAQFADKVLDSVYIGGGTPTTLEAAQLDRLLAALRRTFDFREVKEFTVEAGRADSITADKLEVLLRHDVTRISVNPQTMNQKTLDAIGRRATVEQVVEAYTLARKMGFDNINMDLILGLPGEREADVQYTIDRVTELAPDSLTVHSLAIKRASKLNQWIQENGISMLHNTEETMAIAARGAEKLGMYPYYLYRQKNMSGNFENVGYAKPGKYGLYNILIMEEKQSIVALGAGSISKRVFPDGRIERCENVKEIGLYIEKIDEMIERKKRLFGE